MKVARIPIQSKCERTTQQSQETQRKTTQFALSRHFSTSCSQWEGVFTLDNKIRFPLLPDMNFQQHQVTSESIVLRKDALFGIL